MKYQCFERIDKQNQLKLQFCRNRLKIEQNCRTVIDVGTKLYAKSQ